MSASAYSLTAMFPSSGFVIKEGEPVIGGMHGDDPLSRHRGQMTPAKHSDLSSAA